jgi:lipopolysaccharide export LptBFGC system permease protein LptF
MALDQALGHPPEGSPTPYDVTLIPSLTVDENEVAGERFLVKEDDLTKRLAMTGRQNQGQIYALQTSLDSFWVEIHKKFAISFACIVFVLMGAPLAIRFPRGGVGMVIAVSVGIFAVYWAGLIGGENLADKGVVTPFLAMWTPDLAFLALGLFLALRMGKSTGANRGGGLDEVLFTVGDFARRLMRPRRASA